MKHLSMNKTIQKYYKQPLGCDAQLAGTQIVRGMSGDCLWKTSEACPDHKSLRATVMICDTLVNTHTHIHRERERGGETTFDRLYN